MKEYFKGALRKAGSRLTRAPFRHELPLAPKLLATFFYTGYFPFASGTAGTFVACLVYYVIPALHDPLVLGGATIVFFILGTVAANVVEKVSGEHDSRIIVIDEVVGMWITLLSPWMIPDWRILCIGFVAFRLADIFKPYPASIFDKRKGGFAVMMDDVIAGIYANILTHAVVYVFGGALLAWKLFSH